MASVDKDYKRFQPGRNVWKLHHRSRRVSIYISMAKSFIHLS